MAPPCGVCHGPVAKRAVALSFGVGWSGSGVSWHVHGAGYSEVLWGRKRWLLYPPSAGRDWLPPGFDPNASTASWVEQVLPRLPAQERPLDCVIGPGEVLYFPSQWAHATLNLSPFTAFVSSFLAFEEDPRAAAAAS